MTVVCTCHPGELNRHRSIHVPREVGRAEDKRVNNLNRRTRGRLDALNDVDAHAADSTGTAGESTDSEVRDA